MTDNEIMKALECCCGDDMGCKSCPMFDELNSACVRTTIRSALDLINRQKAEIEKLNTSLNEAKEKSAYFINEVEKARKETRNVTDMAAKLKERNMKLNTVNAEMHESLRLACETNKDLQAEVERLAEENKSFADIGKMYSEIKAEAIKECIEKTQAFFGDKMPWCC